MGVASVGGKMDRRNRLTRVARAWYWTRMRERPKKDSSEPKTATLHVVVTEAEREAVQRAAVSEGRTVSAWCRRALCAVFAPGVK
jgi:hypothetical protein